MLAVDDTQVSILALKKAIQFAKEQEAKLYIVHVVDTLYEGDIRRDEFVESKKKQGHEVLKSIKKKLSRSKIDFEMILSELTASKPQIAEKLVEEADTLAADLIVLGTHGRSDIDHILSGSIAEEMIRLTKIPVFVVPG
jgi:nucleotide-binding universal stress UspA family protein